MPLLPSRSSRRLFIVGIILVAAIACIAGLLIVLQREASLAEAQEETANIARVLVEQTSYSMQAVDLTLREVAGRLSNLDGSTPESVAATARTRATFDLLTEKIKALPQSDAVFVVAADGDMVSNSRGFPTTPLNLADRDYFQNFPTRDDGSLFVSAPVRSKMSGQWSVYLSRRMSGAHGEFLGVVAASVTLSYLENFYRAVTPQHGAVAVLRRDGTILVRFPHDDHHIGLKLPPTAPWYNLLQSGGSYWSSGYVDGLPSIVSVLPMRDIPMVIDASKTEVAALSGWHRQVVWITAGAAMAAACVIFLLRVFGMQFERLERSEASLVRQNAQLERSSLQFDAVLENISQGLTFFDVDQKLMVCNRRFAEIYRLSFEQTAVGTTLAEILDYRAASGTFVTMSVNEYLARRAENSQSVQPYDVTDELSDGRTIIIHYQPMADGGWVATHEDITERRRTEASLAFMARHDALTGLPNRTLFHERLAEAIDAARQGTFCALLYLDLDRFKVINDTLGHPVGDSLLCAVAQRLNGAVRDIDTVARLGGDEFAIVQVGIISLNDANSLAERIIDAIRQPYDIDGHRIVAGTSIGVSTAPTDGTTSEALLRNADIALYLAKTDGRGSHRFFEPEMDARAQQLREVELDLRNALPADDFQLHYQPIINLQSAKVTGFEALIRWNHPMRGMVSPADFIPIAEETGLIVAIGAWVLATACLEASRWPESIEVAVNLSPAQFKDAHVFEVVQAALATSGLAPDRLILEITESVLLQNSDDRLALLHRFRALGIRIALDDFGTGYSSLSYLRSFPFDMIKIDQSFIRDVDTNKDSLIIVDVIIGLANSLGMITVAEGVETPQQLATLRDRGCIKVQGYLFSRPVPAGQISGLMHTLGVNQQHDPAPAKVSEAAQDRVGTQLALLG